MSVATLASIPAGLAYGKHTLDDGVVVVVNGNGKTQWRSDCSACADTTPGGFQPDHDASTRCNSGGRSHCTCNACF